MRFELTRVTPIDFESIALTARPSCHDKPHTNTHKNTNTNTQTPNTHNTQLTHTRKHDRPHTKNTNNTHTHTHTPIQPTSARDQQEQQQQQQQEQTASATGGGALFTTPAPPPQQTNDRLPFFTLHHLPSTLHSPRDCRGGRDHGGKC